MIVLFALAVQLLPIPMDPALNANQNAQRYYKKYRKAKVAEEKLTEQITFAQQEVEYLDSVLDELGRAETEKDLSEIRQDSDNPGGCDAAF